MIRTNEELLQLPVNKKQCIDSSTVLDFPYLSPNDISMFQTQWNSPIIDSSNTTTINHHSDDDAPASHQHVLLNMGGPGQVVTVIDKHSTTTNIAASASAFPFRHGIISNIFDPDIMMDVKRELLNEPFFHKSNE